MADQNRSELIKKYPIGNGLDAFLASFSSTCEDRSLPHSDILDRLDRQDVQDIVFNLLSALQILPALRHLRSKIGSGTLRTDLLKLNSAVDSDDFDFDRIRPLFDAVLKKRPDNEIWDQVYSAVTESTPPPRPILSSIQQTPLSQNTSGLVNSSECRQNVDPILKLELEHLYVGLPHFHKAFFGDVPDLDMVSEAVFRRCTEGDNPLFKDGWSGWPACAKESDVLTWFGGLIPKLEEFAGDRISPAARRKLDITYNPNSEDLRYRWSHILVAGELKSNPKADTASIAWIDLASLCGSLMRVWEFDRLGGIASEQFDINKKYGGLQFVTAILGFLRMNKGMLGFDPTMIISGGQQYIEIERNGKTERLIIDDVMKRARCIAGRATICWKAHRKEDPQTPLVIKDSWQYTDRDEEGILVQEATEKGVINVARYYHHGNVRVRCADDDVQNNVRKGLDITKATNYRSERAILPSSASASSMSRKGQSSGAGVKRPSSETDAILPPSKRSGSTSPVKASVEAQPNRVHRRVILRDYGKPIYNASSPVAMLAALEDISINNLMINEDDENPSRRAFLIDLDLAIKAQREGASGAKGKTGTRAFMAIGALLGKDVGATEFESWNYQSDNQLVRSKKGVIDDEDDFLRTSEEVFTPYYQALIPWVNRLRRKVFPNGERWKKPAPELYRTMKDIIREAQKDKKVLGT
ncbi:uncharacterized protein HRG_06132 [Hirsutella rhossiliensis]|uniref:Fungal-type protein kinase domain-containing protein n=1 Tax=Hirsutella rhossiliensis TaxID=111463 RepID=A0A9P8MZ29_9HYPO|nr:uncharacterized protein HRG_06132 [Hirsutella rhossiliensis]KAH0963622.1 hypothetical protein HRG_06132 [Hirsutella rhossiliensis]